MKYKKSEESVEEIINYALKEFSSHGYEEGSITRVCKETNLSKGRIYHHFKSKDDIFLACIEKVFNDLVQVLTSHQYPPKIEEALAYYFDQRNHFFETHPYHFRLFFVATVTPPNHLAEQIKQLKQEFDTYNLNFIKELLASEELNEYFNLEDAIIAFSLFQDYYNHIAYRNKQMPNLQSNEQAIKRRIHFFLHGILKD